MQALKYALGLAVVGLAFLPLGQLITFVKSRLVATTMGLHNS